MEKVKFICGLSNGESLIEGQDRLSYVAGEDSPWRKLQKYINDNELKITSLSLVCKTELGNRHYNLPNAKPRFFGYEGRIPKDYRVFRRVYTEGATGGGYEHYTVAEAVYEDCRVQLWVSELDPDKSWVNLVEVGNGSM